MVVAVFVGALVMFVVGFAVAWLLGGASFPALGLAVAFILGFVIAWLAEWWIDVAYRQMRTLQQELAGRGGAAPSALSPASVGVAASVEGGAAEAVRTFKGLLEEREAEVEELRAKLEAREADLDNLRAEFDAYVQTHPDDLTAIKGIGRIYQWKLRDAGLSSYAQLAETTPERLRQILDVPEWRKIEPEKWIEQARVLAKRGES